MTEPPAGRGVMTSTLERMFGRGWYARRKIRAWWLIETAKTYRHRLPHKRVTRWWLALRGWTLWLVLGCPDLWEYQRRD